MSAKDKAKELVEKYFNASFNCKDCDIPFCESPCTMLDLREAKQCALICADEIIEILWHTCKNENEYRYWIEVKQEIQKL
jgi:hypothetical protein